MICIILMLFALLVTFFLIVLSFLFIYGYYKNNKETMPNFTPEACVIVPCKGKEQNLEQNLEAICTQNYPNYTVIFVLDSEKDAAYPAVYKTVQKNRNSKIEFSKKLEGASGKVSALIAGVKKAGAAEVYVFADSDIYPQKDWLRNLVSYLSDEKIGATTGFRWYFPHDWKSSLISTWNMSTISALFYQIFNYTWGGSNAIKSSLFKKLDVESKWKKGFSDDLILTETLKKAGYKIKFVPKCIVDSPLDIDFIKFLKWSSQQLTWERWYNPFYWSIYFFGILFLQFLTVLGFILIFVGFTIPGLIIISTIFFEMIYGLVGILTLKKLMAYPKKKFRFVYRYAILMPVVFFLLAYNALVSSVKKQIVWGGRTYRKKDVR